MRRGTEPAYKMGEHLSSIRQELGISMTALAKRMAIPTSSVSQVEKGQRALKEYKLEMWAEALETPLDELHRTWSLLDQEPVPPVVRGRPPEEKSLYEQLLKGLNVNQLNRVRGYIERMLEESEI